MAGNDPEIRERAGEDKDNLQAVQGGCTDPGGGCSLREKYNSYEYIHCISIRFCLASSLPSLLANGILIHILRVDGCDNNSHMRTLNTLS